MTRRTAIAAALGEDPAAVRLEPAGGGCINRAAIVTAPGRTLFAKWNDRPLPRQFEAEAAGLRALRASGTSLVVPEPIAFSDEAGGAFLVLEHVPAGRPGRGYDEAFGRGLAELHRASAEEGFGFALDGYCGATPQPNGWLPDWVGFYRSRRLGHQLRLARDRGFPKADSARADRLLERLADLLGPPEPPALIHGDLWSGNDHPTTDGRPGVIDPAAYYGHREAELGMMVLFGGFSERVFAAYDEAFPLAEGWRERLGLYTLYHVLNHFNLFGGGYASQAARLVRRYVG